MKVPKAVKNLIEAFERLPGIGPKTAQRLTFYLLHVPESEVQEFSTALMDLKSRIKLCSICKNVGESEICEVCSDEKRDRSKIAVVESPLDVLALERAGFTGLYHVLHGVISPLNNVGPDEIFIDHFIQRIKRGVNSQELAVSEVLYEGNVDEASSQIESAPISEVILATNTNLEGESTSMYISKLIQEIINSGKDIRITRIARGLPVGGDIVYADDITLKRALDGRVNY